MTDFYSENVIADFIRVAAILGFDVSERDVEYSGFWSQGDGASFTGSYQYVKGSAKKIRQFVPHDTELHEIADELQELQRRNFYQLRASITRITSCYCHENTIHCGDVERDTWEYREPTVDAEDTMTDAARRLSQWLYSRLESEYEYQDSWRNGQSARDDASHMRECGAAYVAALRDLCGAWRARRGVALFDSVTMRAAIRDIVRRVRVTSEEYHAAREDWRESINQTQFDNAAWREGYSQ